MLEKQIKEYVLGECDKNRTFFGSRFFQHHLTVVADYAKRLAENLGADHEVVELSAYLHDISVVHDAGTIQNHHVLSADSAEKILNRYGYAPNLIIQVRQCILSHLSPLQIGDGSPESVCLSNADAISQIVKPVYWLYFAYEFRNLGFEEGREWLLNRMESTWNGLIDPAKKLIEAQYRATKEILKA